MGKNHNGENWPYHENRNGEMVACAANPCKLHGGSDIMASSPEEATKLHYDGMEPQGMSSPHSTDMTPGEVKAQQDELNGKLKHYADKGWQGWHLERTNGGQYSGWQGKEYQQMNRHLDEIEQDSGIDGKTKAAYNRFVARRLEHDKSGISNGAATLPVRFLLSGDALKHASSFSIPTNDGYMKDTTSLLHHGLHEGEVESMRSLSMMFDGRKGNPLSIDRAARLSTKEWGTTGDRILLDASTKPWGEFSLSESSASASHLPASWDDDSRSRSSIERVREWGEAVHASDGYADHISSRSLHSFGVDNGDVIMNAMHPHYYYKSKSSQVDERDIRAISKHTAKEVFSQSYAIGSGDDPAAEQARKRFFERKDKRCRAIFRCTAVADRLGVPVQTVYHGLLADAKNGGTAINDVMNGDANRGAASVMRIFNRG